MKTTTRTAIAVLALHVTVAPAFAGSEPQAINIDINADQILPPTPTDTYGAAANQPGVWNAIWAGDDSLVINLVDTTGAPSGVRMRRTSSDTWQTECLGGAIPQDWAALMCDHAWSSAAVQTAIEYEFQALNTGIYDFFIYACEPGEVVEPHSIRASTHINQAPHGQDEVLTGEVLSTAFVEGNTHVVIPVAVIFSDTVRVRINGVLKGTSNNTLNGIQIVPRTTCEGDINGDGAVDLADLQLLLFHFGTVCP